MDVDISLVFIAKLTISSNHRLEEIEEQSPDFCRESKVFANGGDRNEAWKRARND